MGWTMAQERKHHSSFPIWILHWKFCTLTLIFPHQGVKQTSQQQKTLGRESDLMLDYTCSQKTWMNVFLKTVRLIYIKQIKWNDQINTFSISVVPNKYIHFWLLSHTFVIERITLHPSNINELELPRRPHVSLLWLTNPMPNKQSWIWVFLIW